MPRPHYRQEYPQVISDRMHDHVGTLPRATNEFMSTVAKSVIILSTKSSGSSALQELLCRFGGGRHIARTRHSEFESLYWTKAASILGLPQVRLPDSEVPIERQRAARDLVSLLTKNVPGFALPSSELELVFHGWHALCVTHAPTFVEKSPHHLHQWSCLDLMLQAVDRLSDIDFRFVGLVRNPMDVLYSAWSRWRVSPEVNERHWVHAYENLERFRASLPGDRVVTVRYEDLASDPRTASRLLSALGMPTVRDGVDRHFHGSSRHKWKDDESFGFQLRPSAVALAERLGYGRTDLTNESNWHWPLRRSTTRLGYLALRSLRRGARVLARRTG